MASIYDNILNGTFASLGVPQQPTMQPGMLGRGLPSDRLPQGLPGLPNPSPGSGMTPQQVAALGGWTMDNQTGQFGYVPPAPTNPAVSAATTAATGGVPMPSQPNVNAVSSAMAPGTPGGGILELLTGPSKNGLGGLAGLMGGPQQGGLLQMLFGGGQPGSPTPRTAPPPSYVAPGGALMPLTSMSGAPRRTYGDGGDSFSGAASEKNVQTANRMTGSARR